MLFAFWGMKRAVSEPEPSTGTAGPPSRFGRLSGWSTTPSERFGFTMRAMTEAIAVVSFDGFLAREQRSERRHELVGGRVYAMSGGSERHDLAAGLVYELLASGARASGCRPFTSNRLVRTRSGNAYYPDVMVVCGQAPHRLYETDPALIVEVLPPSTADVDRREKAVAYAEAMSLRHGRSAGQVKCWPPSSATSTLTRSTTASTAWRPRPDRSTRPLRLFVTQDLACGDPGGAALGAGRGDQPDGDGDGDHDRHPG